MHYYTIIINLIIIIIYFYFYYFSYYYFYYFNFISMTGSTGLDLSFATHIFLLERIKDPALHNQIISRAHRMGATGPVEVTLIQVRSDDSNKSVTIAD
jgi:hypothetical protein